MKRISTEEIRGSGGREHILKDENDITLGRYVLVEENHATKSVLLRLRFYKEDNASLFREALRVLTRNLLRGGRFFKVNVLVAETVQTQPFTSLGFALEGILVNNVYLDSEVQNEYIFGTDNVRFLQQREFHLLALEGREVTLKLGTPDQVADYVAYYRENRTYLAPYEPKREEAFYTEAGQRKSLEEMFKNYLNGFAVNFGVYREERLIGKVQLSNLLYGGFRSALLGYALSKEQEGKGLMLDALETVVEYAFTDLGLHRLEASTLLDNHRSQRTLERLGFRKVGLNPGYLHINGAWRDHCTYALIKEWTAH